ncbi:MAG: TIGR03790 family protein [Acidobacteriaceae bacterium]
MSLKAPLLAVVLAATCAVCTLAVPSFAAQPSLSARVLIVYNSNNTDSQNVALHYQGARVIPAQNLCPIRPSSTQQLSWANYLSQVKAPIQNCLNALGPANILYIVFTYQTPFTLFGPDGKLYALDSFVADIWDAAVPAGHYGYPLPNHPYFADAQTQGNLYLPFQSLAAYRAQPGSGLVYSVWRLDAPSAAIANGLVDNAIATEVNGLNGQVCIDRRYNHLPTRTDYNYYTADWDLHNAANFARAAGFTVTEDENATEFGTAPAPLRCDNVALYSGWYGHVYNDAFTWNPGSIGFHLDSASAANPRVGTDWAEGALQRGITVTSGSVAEPYLIGLAHPDQVFRNLFEGSNVGDAFLRGTPWLKWVVLYIGDPLYRPFPNGFPNVTAPQNVLAFNPQYVVGGKPSQGTITLAAPAPPGGATITLQNPQHAVLTMPSSISVPAGARSANFPISTVLVTNDTPTIITATFGSNVITNSIIPEPLLGGEILGCCAIGGSPMTGLMLLDDNAPPGGVVVNFSSNNPAATVPATVTFPAGTFYQNFTVQTHPVDATTNLTLTASYAGSMQPAYVTVMAPTLYSVTLPYHVRGGQNFTGGAVLTGPAGPSGAVVTLSSSNPAVVSVPSSIAIAPGTTSSNFNAVTTHVSQNTAVTISGTWGSYTRRNTITITP